MERQRFSVERIGPVAPPMFCRQDSGEGGRRVTMCPMLAANGPSYFSTRSPASSRAALSRVIAGG